jgi:hypothetical protein
MLRTVPPTGKSSTFLAPTYATVTPQVSLKQIKLLACRRPNSHVFPRRLLANQRIIPRQLPLHRQDITPTQHQNHLRRLRPVSGRHHPPDCPPGRTIRAKMFGVRQRKAIQVSHTLSRHDYCKSLQRCVFHGTLRRSASRRVPFHRVDL